MEGPLKEIKPNVAESDANNLMVLEIPVEQNNKENAFISLTDPDGPPASKMAPKTENTGKNQAQLYEKPRWSILKEFDPLAGSPITRKADKSARELSLLTEKPANQKLEFTENYEESITREKSTDNSGEFGNSTNHSIEFRTSIDSLEPHEKSPEISIEKSNNFINFINHLEAPEDTKKLETKEPADVVISESCEQILKVSVSVDTADETFSQDTSDQQTLDEFEQLEESCKVQELESINSDLNCNTSNVTELTQQVIVTQEPNFLPVLLSNESETEPKEISSQETDSKLENIKECLQKETISVDIDDGVIKSDSFSDPKQTEILNQTSIILSSSNNKELSQQVIETQHPDLDSSTVLLSNESESEPKEISSQETDSKLEGIEEYAQKEIISVDIHHGAITSESVVNSKQNKVENLNPSNLKELSLQLIETQHPDLDSSTVLLSNESETEPKEISSEEIYSKLENIEECVPKKTISSDTDDGVLKSDSVVNSKQENVENLNETTVILSPSNVKELSEQVIVTQETDFDSLPVSLSNESKAEPNEISSEETDSNLENINECVQNLNKSIVIVSPCSKSQAQGLSPNTTTSVVEHENSFSEEPQELIRLQNDFVTRRKTPNSNELIKNVRRSYQNFCMNTACQTSEQFEPLVDVNVHKEMTDELHELRKENSELKLQLNAVQQAKATLELEIRQKEEVIIKTQAEAINTEQAYKMEIKQLKEKLKENSEIIDKSSTKILEQQVKEAKENEAKAIAELNQRTKDDLNYQVLLEDYENLFSAKCTELMKLQEGYDVTQRHFANLEMAFSDVHSKYEKTKEVLLKMKLKQEGLENNLQAATQSNLLQEERYDSLKAHARGQIEKSNRDLILMREQYEAEISKLKALVKRFEIKCKSLEVALLQKDEENKQLSALCDEVTGKRL